LTTLELHVVAEVTFFPKVSGLRTKLLQVGKNLCANTTPQMGCFVNNTWQNLAKCWTDFYGFTHNFLVSRPFSTRKVLNRSSRCVLSNGEMVVSQILLLVRSRPWSNLVNLSQLWSNLVKPPQTSTNALLVTS
jgi:hypothetical protein